MVDYINGRAPSDTVEIHLEEAWEVLYWTDTLGMNEKSLRRLIDQVGNSAVAIPGALNRRPSPLLFRD
jgi:hypothetical protein